MRKQTHDRSKRLTTITLLLAVVCLCLKPGVVATPANPNESVGITNLIEYQAPGAVFDGNVFVDYDY